MNKLLLCPFCGGEARFHVLNESNGIGCVRCTECGISTDENLTGQFATAIWNTRKPMKKIKEELKINSQNIALIYSTDDGIDFTEDVGLSIDKAIEIVEKGGME